MATLFEAIAVHGPKLLYNRTLEIDQIAEYLASRSGVPPAQTEMVLKEMRAAAIYFCRTGTPVRLPGVGRFRPSLDRFGTFHVNMVPDPAVARALNAPGTYTGVILNAANVGLPNEAYKALWDNDHPDDPVELAG